MPLATKNNAIILKDGQIAENCGCCGGWYCDDCTSCEGGAIPSVINALFTMTVNDGSCQFPLRMVRAESDVRMTPFSCGLYVAYWGVGANPNWLGYQDADAHITFTFDAGYGNPQQIRFDFSGAVGLLFTGACYQFNADTSMKNRIELTTNDLNGYLVPFQWRLKDGASVIDGVQGTLSRRYISPEYVSRSSGLCYSDMPAFSGIPISAGLFYKTYDGTIGLSVTSVE